MRIALAITAAFLLAALGAAPGVDVAPDQRNGDARVRGIALGLFASDTSYDYSGLLREVRSRGATDVSIVVQWTMPHSWSAEVRTDGPKTAPREVVRSTIVTARELGMRVTVMPIIRLEERSPRQWRGNIAPPPEAWFESYSNELARLADDAQAAGAERLVVGSELTTMQGHEDQWRKLITGVRGRFSGRLSYSANWDAHESVSFWDALDEVGVTAYWPLSSSPSPGADELRSAWTSPKAELRGLKARTGKPVVLTEVGYPSHDGAARSPWDQTASTNPAPALQARLFRVFCDEVANSDIVDGYFAWNWFGFGGPAEVSFTPRGKPAAAELQRCLQMRSSDE